MARECIFRASGGTRFKNFCQPWWWKGWGKTPSCNQSAQKNSGCVTALSKFSFPQSFCSKFYSNGSLMSFKPYKLSSHSSFPVKVLLSAKFLFKFYSKGRHMYFQTISSNILLESVFRSLLIGPWSWEWVVAAEL